MFSHTPLLRLFQRPGFTTNYRFIVIAISVHLFFQLLPTTNATLRTMLIISQFQVFRVIFMLSTIVFVTDCCSSRILLLKDRRSSARLMMQQEHDLLPTDRNSFESTPPPSTPFDSSSESIDIINSTTMVLTFNLSEEDDMVESTAESTTAIDFLESEYTSDNVLNVTEKSLLDPGALDAAPATNETAELGEGGFNASDFITDPSVRSQHAGDPKYHVIDAYYKIMRDVLSFECTGQFLTEFCLNKGRCFRYPIGNHSFYSCECADGYTGERCESKIINGVYVPTTIIDMRRTKILTARIVFSFPMLIAISIVYIVIGATIVFKSCPNDSNCKLKYFH